MRTRRKGRWLPRQPRLGARMCQGTFFLCYRAGQSVLVWAGETFIGSCQSDKDGIFQTGMVYSTQQDKGIDTNEKKTGNSSMSDGSNDAVFRLHAEYQ